MFFQTVTKYGIERFKLELLIKYNVKMSMARIRVNLVSLYKRISYYDNNKPDSAALAKYEEDRPHCLNVLSRKSLYIWNVSL